VGVAVGLDEGMVVTVGLNVGVLVAAGSPTHATASTSA
jgi:hypothetical protein